MSSSSVTLTFLFTDIQGSTRSWEADARAMSVALARHDAILRAAIIGRRGRILKTMGDAFCAAFTEPADAVQAALRIQRDLMAEDWSSIGPLSPGLPVRSALHTGPVEVRDDDCFGPTLNRVARLLGVAHGGQVLLSGTTASLVADAVASPDTKEGAWSLRDLGRHRLRDLSRPEEIFQLLAPDLPASFPPLRSLDAGRHNLPQQLSSFIGREDDLARLAEGLAARRLLTLVGPGGTGKTRLALQGAAEIMDRFADGVWLVDLAPLLDGSLIATTALAALDEREQPGQAAVDTLAAVLSQAVVLLILDNCEHVVEDAASVANSLLEDCPGLRILATSRLPLHVPGEQVLPLAPLSVPDERWADQDPEQRPSGSDDLERLQASEGVRLFVDRAALVRPGFVVDAQSAPAVAAVVQHLDGIPLALELAAARLRVMGIEQLASRLGDRFRMLTGGARTLLPRQQTLRAAIDWSYDLLEPADRLLLARLAVFRGGWTLEAAEAVCADGPDASFAPSLDPWEVVERLGRLVDHSLVVLDEGQDQRASRYRFLETIQAYARERLFAGGQVDELVLRHLRWLEALTAEVEAHRNGPEGATWLRLADPERDNLRAALEAVTTASVASVPALEITSRLWWLLSARWGHGRDWAERLEALFRACGSVPDEELLARATYSLSICVRRSGQTERGKAYLEQALDLARRGGLHMLEAWCLNDLGNMARHRGELALARELLLASLAIKREVSSPSDLAIGTYNLAHVAFCVGDMAELRRLLTEAAILAEQAGAAGMWAEHTSALAYLDLMEDSLPEARGRMAIAAAAARAAGELQHRVEVADYAMVLALVERQLPSALAFAAEAWRFTVQRREARPHLLHHGSWLAATLGDHAMAARLLGCADAAPPDLGFMGLHPHDWAIMLGERERSRKALGPEAWDAAFAAGQRLPAREGHREALAWVEARLAAPALEGGGDRHG